MRRFSIGIAPPLPLLVAACAGAAGPGRAVDPAADHPAERAASSAPASPSPPTCEDWGRWDFFESASAQLVQECLRAGADPNEGPYHHHPIFRAARDATDPAVIALLVDAGADAVGSGRSSAVPGITPLHTAAAMNPTPGIIDALVAAGADIEARNLHDETPLHWAWRNPNPAVVQALLRLGADPLAADYHGRSANPTGCPNWNTAAFARLALLADFERCLDEDADMHARDDRGNTILHHAAANADAAVVALLLQAGADANARNGNGTTPLHRAAETGIPATVRLLLEAGADTHVPAGYGHTPLHSASRNGRSEIVTALLAAGAGVNAGTGGYGTPLFDAIGYQRGTREATEATINALLDAGADVNAADSFGETPLLASLGFPDPRGPAADLPLRLLALGADPNAGNVWGWTPLFMAAGYEQPSVVRALLDAGADPHALSDGGESPLHNAAEFSIPEVITLLAEAGVDVNGLNDDARAPLHLAVSSIGHHGSPGAPEEPRWRARTFALLDAGADPNVRNGQGDTPLHLSAERLDTVLVSGLVAAGADVSARNDLGQTPLHKAHAHNAFLTARKLLELGADPGARANAGRTADASCHWGGGDFRRGWDFLARSPAESVQGCLQSGAPADARDDEGATPLAGMVSAESCCADFENVLGLFVAAGADVNARDQAGRTPLHRVTNMSLWVPQSIRSRVASALLAAGADPNARDNAGRTPLHPGFFGAKMGVLVPLLAAAGADLDARDDAGRTPLHVVLRHGDVAAVRSLLRLGADPAARDSAGNAADPVACERWGTRSFFALASAPVVAGCVAAGADVHANVNAFLHAVAWTPDPAVVSILLQAGVNVKERDDHDCAPIHHAARRGTAGVVRALLEAGADADARTTCFGIHGGSSWTPLHLAAEHNREPGVVTVLLEAGADLDAPTKEGRAPLHQAAANANPAVTEVLLEAGADVNAPSRAGETPLHVAARENSNPAVPTLQLQAGADVNARDPRGYTPLHTAAENNANPEIVTALITAGADVNARDPDGYVPPGRPANDRTPLLLALYRGGSVMGGAPEPTGRNVPVVEVLVRAGGDLELTDGSGRTALHTAAIWTPAAFPLLLRLGADPNARDEDGKTPWDYALQNRSLQGLEEVRRMREEMRRGGAAQE